ncbi:hypothetical protein Agabi119p4_3277 [Agaricus bisporus var. burnettii]|uniref:Integrase catalytic domain-containing protein n=1 Tax=Agaricus bisporus var. burnettii TaxID=192524 RepID=A0A8H7F6S6_AGABI|nr:hypothetical protein Agabi119p4_3277 [Agaricus bisporus var. burnettii]
MSTNTGGSAPPIFADTAKFNGTNWVSWNGMIHIAAELRGVFGYLDGTIPNPATTTITPPATIPLPTLPTQTTTTATSPTTETPWESTTPSPAEWKVRNAWAKGLLIYNTTDPVGLGISIGGTAADAWKSYLDNYEVASEIALLNVEMELRNMIYNDGEDFTEFISRLRTKWSNANALGAKIDDKSFRTIILSSLPRSWDPIVATLYTTQSSRDAIQQLLTHWARVSRNRVTTSQTTSALQANTQSRGRDRQRNQFICTNQNCNRRGHTIEFCYWPGGGKAGQFPEGFGRRGGARGSASATTTGNYQTAANNTTTTSTEGANGPEKREPQVFALAAITEVTSPNGIITLLDSGASDHCFVNKQSFITYNSIIPPRQGNSAGKGSTFVINGAGEAEVYAPLNGALARIVLSGALHTPHLRSNLISVSKLVSRGSSVSFEGNTAIVRNSARNVALVAVKENGLYVVPSSDVHANAVQAKGRAVPIDIWHRRLGHISIEVVKRMLKGNLVDGLNVVGPMELEGLCEDCIFGKHTSHPYTGHATIETQPLQRVYIDIWGPSPVQSAGGAKYFMLIVDGATSYRKLYFLTTKSADATLEAFKEFHREAERQTGRTLKEVRLDMGREWHNDLWSTYVKEHGIVLNFTTPYAHQQNGKAERSMRTLLDMARAMLADSGLPQKYWADAVQTAAYIRNFTPPANNPSHIPAELWSGLRQSVSHLRPFGSTAYAHIPVEIHNSKLSPRSVKLTLVGYYGHTGYKLLDRTTGAAYKSRDVIFEETRPHLSTDKIITFPIDDSRARYSSEIAPRPKAINTLHEATGTGTASRPVIPPSHDGVATIVEVEDGDGMEVNKAVELPLALRRSRREVKPSQRMKESMEYLERPEANVATSISDDIVVPKTYREAMKKPDLWLEPMLKELRAMEEKGVFRLVPRPNNLTQRACPMLVP